MTQGGVSRRSAAFYLAQQNMLDILLKWPNVKNIILSFTSLGELFQ